MQADLSRSIKEPNVRRDVKTRGEKVFNGFNYCFFILLGVIMVYPFWHVVMYSFSEVALAGTGGVFLLPRGFTLDSYRSVLMTKAVREGFLTSVLVTGIGTALGTLVTAMTAYSLSKKRLLGSKVIMFLIFFTMLFSGGMIPSYMLIKNLKLLNNLWALILPGLISAYNVIIMRSFFSGLPVSLEESAKIDGANDLLIFFRIVFPVSYAVMATIALFMAVGYWNDYFSTVLYITSDPSKHSLQFVLRQLLTSTSSAMSSAGINVAHVQTITTESIRSTTVVVATVPILVVYPFLQKYFVKGVMVGSIKG